MTYKSYEVRVYENGTKEWLLDDKLHREDGPAIERSDESKYWFLDGKLHRVDGPAVEWYDGSAEWFLDGNRHREDGPAIEWPDGTKYWYLNGKLMSEQDFKKKMNSCSGKIVEIDGKKYRLSEI